MEIDNLIKEYIKSEEINPKHHKRLLTKIHLLNRFKEFLYERSVEEIRVREALEYQGWLIDQGNKDDSSYSNSTVTEYIVTISGFYDYLKSCNYVYDNPFRSIKRLRVDKKIPRNILSEKNMDKFLKHFRNWNQESNLKRRISLYKMHVISELMYSTGLRINEVANLEIEDINLFNESVLVKEGKGGFSRTAILNDYAKGVLSLYITKMRELVFTKRNLPNTHLLFGMKPSYFEKYVNESLLKATNYLGLNRVTSHGFRHAVGYHLLKSGCDIRYIQDILGHKSLKNTEIYTKVDKEDLKKTLNRYHPRVFKRIVDESDHNKIKKAI